MKKFIMSFVLLLAFSVVSTMNVNAAEINMYEALIYENSADKSKHVRITRAQIEDALFDDKMKGNYGYSHMQLAGAAYSRGEYVDFLFEKSSFKATINALVVEGKKVTGLDISDGKIEGPGSIVSTAPTVKGFKVVDIK